MLKTINRTYKFRLIYLLTLMMIISFGHLAADFTVISSGEDYTEIEFILPEYEIVSVEYDGIVYQRLFHPEYGYIMEEGLPEVLSFGFLLSIPRTGIAVFENPIVSDNEVQNGIVLFPSQGFNLEIDEKRGFLMDNDFYGKDIDYPGKMVQMGSPAIMRDTRLVPINLNPISYNPAREELTIAKRLTIRINYDLSVQGQNEITIPPRRLSRTFERIGRASIVNYDQFRNPATRNEYQARSMIVVHHHTTDAQYITALNNILNWKRDKGFEITAINTGTYPTREAIRNYLRQAYENWENPPEYVVLVGDTRSNISVPNFVEYQNAYIPRNVNGDHPYSTLAGDDLLADVVVGRISIGSATQLATFWNKLRNYERNPFMGNTAWYNRNLLVADKREGANNSGVSTYYMSLYVKNLMERYNSNYTFNEVYETPFPAQMQAGINQGVSFFVFRGMYGLAGWNPGEQEFTNGYMLPNVVALTCRSMDFEGVWGFSLGHQFRMGTPAAAKGFISAIGISASSDTAFNNYLTGSMFRGIYDHDMLTMGEAMVYGKFEHYRAFWNSHEWRAAHYFQMLNLKGDPTMDVWKGIPQELNATYQQVLTPGSNSNVIIVTDGNDNPVKDAWVTLRQGNIIGEETVFVSGYTNADGEIIHYFDVATAGEVKVTITKPQYQPHLGVFEVTGDAGVTFNEVITNQDFNAGNAVNFALTVRNHRNAAVNGVNGTIATNSDFIEITTNQSAFGNVPANTVTESITNYRITIDPDTPSNYKADFKLTVTDNAQNNWVSRFAIIISNGKLETMQVVVADNDDGVLDPLEQARLLIHIRNVGQVNLSEIHGTLTGGGFGLDLISDEAYFGDIEIDQTVTSTETHFEVSTSSFVIPGMIFDLNLHLYNEAGFSQNIPIKLPIGTVTVDDPLGPDAYGYWIYDSGDTDYMEAPEYEWIEIAPNLGGQGVNTNLTANYNDVQNSRTMDLPFTFRFYGIEYDVVTISANGWITFIETEMATQRNWRLPGALGPDPIIAAFWDNLGLQQGGVYTYFDAEQNYFVIQWQNATNVQQDAPETFQIILYDPEYYFTATTDGPVKIQYKVFNNVNNRGGVPGGPQSQYGEWGNYCTIGISDHTGMRGLEYTFNNEYPTAARPLGNETALYITTGSLGFTPYVVIEEVTYIDENDNIPQFGDTGNFNMRLMNFGGEPATDVSAVLTSNDPLVTILQDTAQFGDMESQQSSAVNDAYTIQIADNIPDKHRLFFVLTISSAENINWNVRFHIDVSAPDLGTLTPFVYDPPDGGNNNGVVDPGEDLVVYLPIKNFGGANSPGANITITSENPLAEITNISQTEFRGIRSEEVMYPAINLSISEDAELGTGLVFSYIFETGEYEFTGNFLLGVGGIIPARMGTGNAETTTATASPINIYFKSIRGQMVYTAEEMRNAGVTTGGPITGFGFYIAGAPAHPLVNFSIRMKHTTAANGAAHIDGPYEQVLPPRNYTPTAGDWDIIELHTPFIWNGEDNILVDTAFAPVANWSSSGQVRYYEVANGFRFARADNVDQTNVETTTTSSEKPQAVFLIDTSAGDTTNRPDNLTATLINENRIDLLWTAPDEQQGLHGYNVYRNGSLVNEEYILEAMYIDNEFDTTSVCYYYVTAVYESGETLPSNIVAVEFKSVLAAQISPDAGNYYEPFDVIISTLSPDAQIYYTLDGSQPTMEDNLYEEPFELNYHSNVKARAFKEGWLPSVITSAQYYVLYPPRNLRAGGTLDAVELEWVAPWAPEEYGQVQTIVRDSRMTSNRGQKDIAQSPTIRSSRSGREYLAETRKSSLTGRQISYNVYRSFMDGEFILLTQEPISETEYLDETPAEGDYRYYVTAVYEQGESQPSTIINVGPTNVDEQDTFPILVTELLNAYPNPFNPETMIKFTLQMPGRVTIELFNISGRRVNKLTDDQYEAGNHKLLWRGEDDYGRRLSSGIYFYRMTTSGYSSTKKVLMLK